LKQRQRIAWCAVLHTFGLTDKWHLQEAKAVLEGRDTEWVGKAVGAGLFLGALIMATIITDYSCRPGSPAAGCGLVRDHRTRSRRSAHPVVRVGALGAKGLRDC